MPRIIFTDQGRKQTIELKDKLITIGRAADNAIVLRDDSISSYHAVLKEKDGNYTLQDLDSTNGMKIDGLRVTSADLEDGTDVKLGDVVGTYESEIPLAKKTPPPSSTSNIDITHEDPDRGKVSGNRSTGGGRKAARDASSKSGAKRKTPPPAVKRSNQMKPPTKVKRGGGCGLLLFTVLALIAPFAGMTYRHYQDTNEWLPVQVWKKISGGAEEAPVDE